MYEVKEVTIEITEDIEKIICENLNEKTKYTQKTIESCKDCYNYDNPWIKGRTLHCCSQDHEHIKTSREIKDLYDTCPISHTLNVTKKYIKKYGIIHRKPSKGRCSFYKGSIHIVDFSDTTFEGDGNNPDVDWEDVIVLYYSTQEEADVMMELALDYYHRFNLDAEYVEKNCYG